MDKLTHFLLVLNSGLYRHFDNMLALFTITNYDNLKRKPYSIVVVDGYYYYLDDELKPRTFSPGIKAGEPLYNYLDKVTVNPGDLINVKEKTETTYGNLYVNTIISGVLGEKLPFITGNMGNNLNDLEQMIADRLVDTPLPEETIPPDKISVKEFQELFAQLQTLEVLGPFVVTAATERNIRAPDGLAEFKKKLEKEYAGQLDDPIVQVDIVKALQAFDEEWLKDDPSNNVVVSGKIKRVARTKSFLIAGNTPNFTSEMSGNFRMKSFADGAETDPKQLAIINSSIRYGSYARGTLTAVAGTIAKAFMQIFSPVTVEDRDCGTKLTRKVVIEGKPGQYVGRNMVVGGKIVRITNANISSLMYETVNMRSPSYCKEGKTEVCRVCAGENLWRFRESLTQAGTDLANTIIYKVFFSVLKGSERISVTIDMDDLVK